MATPAAFESPACQRPRQVRLRLSYQLREAMYALSVDALEKAIMKYGRPVIMNIDQGRQFTSSAFIGLLQERSIQVSMDGKGCWRDNVFVERLWKSVKYEEIYLHGYNTVSDARQALTRYFNFYNRRRPHSTLDDQTPDTAYFTQPPLTAAA